MDIRKSVQRGTRGLCWNIPASEERPIDSRVVTRYEAGTLSGQRFSFYFLPWVTHGDTDWNTVPAAPPSRSKGPGPKMGKLLDTWCPQEDVYGWLVSSVYHWQFVTVWFFIIFGFPCGLIKICLLLQLVAANKFAHGGQLLEIGPAINVRSWRGFKSHRVDLGL